MKVGCSVFGWGSSKRDDEGSEARPVVRRCKGPSGPLMGRQVRRSSSVAAEQRLLGFAVLSARVQEVLTLMMLFNTVRVIVVRGMEGNCTAYGQHLL